MVVTQMNDQQNDISNNKKIIIKQSELLAAQQKTIDELSLKLIDNQINMIDMELKFNNQEQQTKLLCYTLICAIVFMVCSKMLF